jgi:hypothetical protein
LAFRYTVKLGLPGYWRNTDFQANLGVAISSSQLGRPTEITMRLAEQA